MLSEKEKLQESLFGKTLPETTEPPSTSASDSVSSEALVTSTSSTVTTVSGAALLAPKPVTASEAVTSIAAPVTTQSGFSLGFSVSQKSTVSSTLSAPESSVSTNPLLSGGIKAVGLTAKETDTKPQVGVAAAFSAGTTSSSTAISSTPLLNALAKEVKSESEALMLNKSLTATQTTDSVTSTVPSISSEKPPESKATGFSFGLQGSVNKESKPALQSSLGGFSFNSKTDKSTTISETKSIFGTPLSSQLVTSSVGLSPFGQTTTTSASSAGFSFGSQPSGQVSTLGGFSAGTTPATTATPAFGSTPAQAVPSIFGQTSAAATTTVSSAFGQASSAPSMFGQTNQTGSAFGQTVTTSATATFSFGQTTSAGTTPAFGQSQASTGAPSIFGTAPSVTTSSVFGHKPAATPQPLFSFGQNTASTTSTQSTGGFAFGQQSTTSQSSVFGATSSTSSAVTPFGATCATPAFGQAKPAATTASTGFAFGAGTTATAKTTTASIFGGASINQQNSSTGNTINMKPLY